MIETYFLYTPDGVLAGICGTQKDAMDSAVETAKHYGICEVEQIYITAEKSSRKRIRVNADGSFEKLWQKVEGVS